MSFAGHVGTGSSWQVLHGDELMSFRTSSVVTSVHFSKVGVDLCETSYAGVDIVDARTVSTLSLKKAVNSSNTIVCSPSRQPKPSNTSQYDSFISSYYMEYRLYTMSTPQCLAVGYPPRELAWLSSNICSLLDQKVMHSSGNNEKWQSITLVHVQNGNHILTNHFNTSILKPFKRCCYGWNFGLLYRRL